MRLITRANLDGVVCAAMITQMEPIEEVLFANPKDLDDGAVEVRPGDAVANLPFHPNAALWFDHHHPSLERDTEPDVRGRRGDAPSAARLVYQFYEHPDLTRLERLVRETDRIDSADLTINDVLNPKGWVLLSYTLDAYNELPAHHDYVRTLIDKVRLEPDIDKLLQLPEVKARVNRFQLDADDHRTELRNISRLDGNVIVTDFRQVDLMPVGSRFLAFALFPEGDVQVRIYLHEKKIMTRVRLGKSIFNPTCTVHLGRLAAEYGGGGLEGAASCLLEPETADEKLDEIIARLKTA